MGSKCHLYLDKEQPVYVGGEVISGYLEFTTTAREEKLFDVQLIMTGLINKWPQVKVTMGIYRRAARINLPLQFLYKTKRYAIHSFMETKTEAILIQNGDPPLKLPFELKLPTRLFSTFVGHHGYALYKLIVVGKWGTQYGREGGYLFDKDIQLVAKVPALRPNYDLEFSGTQRQTAANGKESSLSVWVDKRCGVPGDRIGFKINFENGQSMPLGCLKFTLQQNVSWSFDTTDLGGVTRNVDRKDVKIILNQEGPSIAPGPGRKLNWTSELKIPHVIPSGKWNDDFGSFTVGYWLIFSASKSTNFKKTVPVHIGTADLGSEEDEMSLAYFSQLRRSLSATSLDALSLSSGDESCWSSLMDLKDSGAGRSSDTDSASVASFGDAETPLPSETPPPPYTEAEGADKTQN